MGRQPPPCWRFCAARNYVARWRKNSRFKLVSLLLYLNQTWTGEGGRLRLLRSPADMGDFALEVAPEGGTLVAFRCTDNAWHGHLPWVGRRRSVMVNYCVDEAVCLRERRRHRLSAKVKKFKGLLGIGRVPTSP